jgi:hypothetical protein
MTDRRTRVSSSSPVSHARAGPRLGAADSGDIAGVVKDGSGAVMPGVTVEAASPAMIEKVRSVVTDSQGFFRIVDLRPGLYSVTFTLPGFSTFKREGIEMTSGFTATVNAEMKVGTLEETVTVSGTAPVVDTQNVIQQTTIPRETLDALPIAKRPSQFITLIPAADSGATNFHDVGGVGTDRGFFGVHGQRPDDMTFNIAGMIRECSVAVASSTPPPSRRSSSRRALAPLKRRPAASRSTSSPRTAATRFREASVPSTPARA